MEQNRIKQITISIWDCLKRLEFLADQLNRSTSPGKRNSLKKDIQFVRAKITHSFKRIAKLVDGNIISVTFLEENSGIKWKRLYTNVSVEDVKSHLKLISYLKEENIQILEIQETKTKNSLTKLS